TDVSPTPQAIAEIATGTVRLNEATASLAADLVTNVREAMKGRLSREDERRIARNTREVLLEVARSRGALLDGAVQLDGLEEKARRQLSAEVGNALVGALADVLRSPTEVQAKTLARWTHAYVAFAIMGLDPTLNSFQASRFNKKIFILDTDI